MNTTCINYILVNPIPQCVTNLTVGTIAALNTAVKVSLMNTATGRTDVYDVTSNGAGLIILPATDIEFIPNTTYTVTVSVAGMNVGITIGAQSEKQILMPVKYVNGLTVGAVTLGIAE